MFPSTQPIGIPDSLRATSLLRGLTAEGRLEVPSNLSQSRLSHSLREDLQRFEHDGIRTQLIEVLAASLRHGTNLLVRLGYGPHELPLTLFPAQRQIHCPLLLPQLLSLRLHDLVVLGVSAADQDAPERMGFYDTWDQTAQYASLDLLSWDLAMRGGRAELLPEISPLAAFRIPPGVSLQGFDISGPVTAALHRLKRQAHNLRELSSWAGFDRERATRLLNALYLQSALMATRTHPAAGDNWAS
jgi:hypothetical protein